MYVDAVDETIREIAAQHGVALGRDDPVLILQTINKRLLADSAKAQQAMLDSYKEELELISQRWGKEAKEKSERILTAALAASKDAMAKVTAEGTTGLMTEMRREIGSALSGISATLGTQIRDAQTIAKINLIAAALTLLAATLALWTMLLK